jgi:hypothetical protein
MEVLTVTTVPLVFIIYPASAGNTGNRDQDEIRKREGNKTPKCHGSGETV